MTPVTAAKVKYGVWGLIGGAIIAMIVGFAWGGWTTSGTTTRMSDESVLAARAAICVAQFMKQPNPQEKLQEFEKVDNYRRSRGSRRYRRIIAHVPLSGNNAWSPKYLY